MASEQKNDKKATMCARCKINPATHRVRYFLAGYGIDELDCDQCAEIARALNLDVTRLSEEQGKQ